MCLSSFTLISLVAPGLLGSSSTNTKWEWWLSREYTEPWGKSCGLYATGSSTLRTWIRRKTEHSMSILMWKIWILAERRRCCFCLLYAVCVCTQTLAASSASRLWIMFQGAMPMATTRTLEEVLAKEWSLTAWPKCLVMPKRRPLVKIQAPREERGSCCIYIYIYIYVCMCVCVCVCVCVLIEINHFFFSHMFLITSQTMAEIL